MAWTERFNAKRGEGGHGAAADLTRRITQGVDYVHRQLELRKATLIQLAGHAEATGLLRTNETPPPAPPPPQLSSGYGQEGARKALRTQPLRPKSTSHAGRAMARAPSPSPSTRASPRHGKFILGAGAPDGHGAHDRGRTGGANRDVGGASVPFVLVRDEQGAEQRASARAVEAVLASFVQATRTQQHEPPQAPAQPEATSSARARALALSLASTWAPITAGATGGAAPTATAGTSVAPYTGWAAPTTAAMPTLTATGAQRPHRLRPRSAPSKRRNVPVMAGATWL